MRLWGCLMQVQMPDAQQTYVQIVAILQEDHADVNMLISNIMVLGSGRQPWPARHPTQQAHFIASAFRHLHPL